MSVADAIATRRSIRAFTDQPVTFEAIARVMEQARLAPSGCNFQPWEATILTGAPLQALRERLLASEPDEPQEYDFSAPGRIDKYKSRLTTFAASMYAASGIQRDDSEKRSAWLKKNVRAFDAPVLLLCHFPKMMESAQWSDVGMWLQTIMLSARGEGLDTCPLEVLGMYGRTIKAHLGLSGDTLLFCGLAIGWRDADAAVNQFERERVALRDNLTFRGF
ncbi:nitroreductase [Lysobacteraceae bacterium NML93-0792]|nr:nitroreductase [Xanthomonadaceae bacterium NML93-0792]PBS16547.1 nitroreductase [Xanthomonadaceae bacterium NML93-0793]PBS19922.1 nitroreductase [Xanthomonadaceae bacterium NML93-0831]